MTAIDVCREEIRCIAIGDVDSGKNELLAACEKFDSNEEREVFLEYTTCKQIRNFIYRFVFTGFSGQERTNNLRRLSYVSPTGVFMVCFSILDQKQFYNAFTYWVAEIKRFANSAPFFVVGTQAQLRDDEETLRKEGKSLVSKKEAETMAEKFNVGYLECAFDDKASVLRVFNTAIEEAVNGSTAKQLRDFYERNCSVM